MPPLFQGKAEVCERKRHEKMKPSKKERRKDTERERESVTNNHQSEFKHGIQEPTVFCVVNSQRGVLVACRLSPL